MDKIEKPFVSAAVTFCWHLSAFFVFHTDLLASFEKENRRVIRKPLLQNKTRSQRPLLCFKIRRYGEFSHLTRRGLGGSLEGSWDFFSKPASPQGPGTGLGPLQLKPCKIHFLHRRKLDVCFCNFPQRPQGQFLSVLSSESGSNSQAFLPHQIASPSMQDTQGQFWLLNNSKAGFWERLAKADFFHGWEAAFWGVSLSGAFGTR